MLFTIQDSKEILASIIKALQAMAKAKVQALPMALLLALLLAELVLIQAWP